MTTMVTDGTQPANSISGIADDETQVWLRHKTCTFTLLQCTDLHPHTSKYTKLHEMHATTHHITLY